MCEEERAYYTHFATNFDSLAPKYQAATTVPPPAAEQGQGEREQGAGQQAEAAVTGGPAGAQAGVGVTSRTGPLPHPGAPQEIAARPEEAGAQARGPRARDGAAAQIAAEARERTRREKLALQAAVQEDLHHQRVRMDNARLGLAERRSRAQEQLRVERERLATWAWWRRPSSLATSSWVSMGGARATTTPTHSAPATAWPQMDVSMLAHAGDTAMVDEGVEEIRTVRLLDNTGDNLAEEVVEMEVDGARDNEEEENRERTVARGKGRGRGKGGRHGDY